VVNTTITVCDVVEAIPRDGVSGFHHWRLHQL